MSISNETMLEELAALQHQIEGGAVWWCTTCEDEASDSCHKTNEMIQTLAAKYKGN